MTKPSPADLPLCVDLDGTLIRSDLLFESAAALVKARPWFLLALPFWLARGLAFLKRRIAESASLDVSALPFHGPLLERLRAQKASGRRLVLATASDIRLARQVADRAGLFDEVLASHDGINLIGEAKARALVERFGKGGFDYAGDDAKDLPVWRAARKAILVDVPESLAAEVAALVPAERISAGGSSRLREAWRALRPYQWGKNLIIFIPIVTSHRWSDLAILGQAFLAAVSFSLCASSVYLLNDLLDLQVDRSTPGKKDRPFAAGTLPLSWALLLLPLLAAAAGVAAFLPKGFALVLASYYALTLLYSWKLRSVVVLDVFCLALLYTARLFAGHAATGIPFSPWLSGFSMFLFLSLALMKRYVEFSGAALSPGRGYGPSDAPLLRDLGVTSGCVSALIFAFYIYSEQVARLYTKPVLLWLICLLILFALGRMWHLARRGRLDEDPVRFVLKDGVSWLCAGLTALVLAAASAQMP
ncbi:MAG: UbiA family prenyltransferase [Elusimicrobia bacterium]|nr:UbiA family prenyltransferase [Elusimicrobiota bacterium]